MEYLLLIVGFVLLVKGADVFVTGAGSVAKKFKIPDLIIGLTIVAFGTSAPEIAVSTVASLGGKNEMAISNILGSNIFNLMVVLGVCAIILPIKVAPSILKREFPMCILATVLLLVMIADKFLGISDVNVLSRVDGIILLVVFAVVMFTIVKSAMGGNKEEAPQEAQEGSEEIKEVSTVTSIVMIVLGLVAVVGGGDLVVDNATIIATTFGMSEALIGLTIIAMGTSLPELVTSIVACKKGSSDMAVGNVIGSNIFNILLTLGIASSISPIQVDVISVYDTIILLIFTLLVFVFCKTKNTISRIEGIILVVVFIIYNYYIFTR